MSEPTDTNDPSTFRVISYADDDAASESVDGRTKIGGTGDTTPISESTAGSQANRSESSGFSATEFSEDLAAATSPDSDNESEESQSTGAESDASQQQSVAGKRIALVGRLGSMNRREAVNVLQSFQAVVVDLQRRKAAAKNVSGFPVDWIVIGADQPPLSMSELLAPDLLDAVARGEVEVLQETELWLRLGLIDAEQTLSSLYTPAMLADLCHVSIRVIRRWHRSGLITPVSTLHKLPYFDYAEVATAKRLAGWIAEGASAGAIERRLVELVQFLPNIRRPLDQLSILVEGKDVLLRQGEGLVEPGGQMRFDFRSLDGEGDSADGREQDETTTPQIVAFEPPDQPPMLRAVGTIERDEILWAAYEAEDRDDLETAVDLYHTILARDGARADICFQLGEILYRMNFLVAARERYYMAIELDPEFVEARASLGAVLAELGQTELAIAALRGALSMHTDYADVHFTLAKTLDCQNDEQALEHWQKIIELAPESPWAEEAKRRLGMDDADR